MITLHYILGFLLIVFVCLLVLVPGNAAKIKKEIKELTISSLRQ